MISSPAPPTPPLQGLRGGMQVQADLAFLHLGSCTGRRQHLHQQEDHGALCCGPTVLWDLGQNRSVSVVCPYPTLRRVVPGPVSSGFRGRKERSLLGSNREGWGAYMLPLVSQAVRSAAPQLTKKRHLPSQRHCTRAPSWPRAWQATGPPSPQVLVPVDTPWHWALRACFARRCLPNGLCSHGSGGNWLPAAPRQARGLWGTQLRRGLGWATCGTMRLANDHLEVPSEPQGPSACQPEGLIGGSDERREHFLGGSCWSSSCPERGCFQARASVMTLWGTPTVLPLRFLTPRPCTGAPAGRALPPALPHPVRCSHL